MEFCHFPAVILRCDIQIPTQAEGIRGTLPMPGVSVAFGEITFGAWLRDGTHRDCHRGMIVW
jgi:hypothetical protein